MLKYRVISSIVFLVALVAIATWCPPVVSWMMLVALSCLAQLEFYTMMNKAGIPVFRVIGLICGAALISATFCTIGPNGAAGAYKWEQVVLVTSFIVIFVRQFPQKNNNKPIETIACTILGILYVPFLFNYFTRLAFAWEGTWCGQGITETGRMMIFYMVVVVKSSDMGAYFVGRAFGKNKMFPRISPGKTWEGFVGGVLSSVLASLLFYHFSGHQLGKVVLALPHVIILGFLLAIVGVVGDLFESLMKRAANTKDSSAMIPGMGGLLDVLDSLLFGAPILYVYAKLFL